MIRRPPRSTQGVSSAASDVYKRQVSTQSTWDEDIRQRNEKIQTMSDAIAKIQKEIETLESNKKALDSQINSQGREISELEKSLSQKNQEINENQDQIKTLEQKLNEIKLGIESSHKERMYYQIGDGVSVGATIIGGIEYIITYSRLQAARVTITELEKSVNSLKETVNNLKKTQQSKMSEIDDLLKKSNAKQTQIQNLKDSIKKLENEKVEINNKICLLYTSPSPRDLSTSRMPSSA
eukprot:TRINITY_DN2341_c0_g1_i16.p1 TRINITY_DN2341_c0_g1~~TRINITY_DN2341_c0_g1_i16.p1  ORF type:complete len:238 (-),score=63.29 TRINITY_DN2341_c0_g1_i16:23-736(-)